MKNRFNINEEEKNRIRLLHGMKVITENIGVEMKSSIDWDSPLATKADYTRFIDCLQDYNIDEAVMSNANVFVNNQVNLLRMDSTDPDYYTMRMGLIGWNLVNNGYDIYNRNSNEPSTCALEILEEFGIGETVN